MGLLFKNQSLVFTISFHDVLFWRQRAGKKNIRLLYVHVLSLIIYSIVLLEKLTVGQLKKNYSIYFIEPEDVVPDLQKSVTGSYRYPNEHSPHLLLHFLHVHFNIILRSKP
jgi:hypothetical protein